MPTTICPHCVVSFATREDPDRQAACPRCGKSLPGAEALPAAHEAGFSPALATGLIFLALGLLVALGTLGEGESVGPIIGAALGGVGLVCLAVALFKR